MSNSAPIETSLLKRSLLILIMALGSFFLWRRSSTATYRTSDLYRMQYPPYNMGRLGGLIRMWLTTNAKAQGWLTGRFLAVRQSRHKRKNSRTRWLPPADKTPEKENRRRKQGSCCKRIWNIIPVFMDSTVRKVPSPILFCRTRRNSCGHVHVNLRGMSCSGPRGRSGPD
jgi:hypothetical protein